MGIKVDSKSRFDYMGADKSHEGIVKVKAKDPKAPKKNNLPVNKNDPEYSDSAHSKARDKKLEGVAHYNDSVQKEAKLKVRNKSLEGVDHFSDSTQKEAHSKARHEKLEGVAHYHDSIQDQARQDSKTALKKGSVRKGRARNKKARKEREQFTKDSDNKDKLEVHFEFDDAKEEQIDEAQQSEVTASQAVTSSEVTKIGSKKTLIMNADLKVGEDNTGYLHVTFSEPSIDEIHFTYKPSRADIKSLDKTMKKFFLSPLERDMTLRVMTLYLNSLAKEFLAQLDYEIVQTKLKVSSIMTQKDELMSQATAKLIGGISESLVTGAAAGVSIGAATSGLKGMVESSAKSTSKINDLTTKIEASEESIKTGDLKVKQLQQEKMELDKNNVPKDNERYKKVESDLEKANEDIDEMTKVKKGFEKLRDTEENEQRTNLRKIDLKVAQLNGVSQLVSAGRGFVTGITDCYVTMNQANIKLQDAIQTQIQLTKDNARMFMQKSNEYITSLLSSLLSIVNSIYQARRGIITS